MKPDVYFLYAGGHKDRGSVVMRCLQLSQMATQHLSDAYTFHTIAMPQKKRGLQINAVADITSSIIILQKALIEHLDADAFAALKSNNIAVLADWVDKPVKSAYLDEIDVHLASSRMQEAELNAQLPGKTVRYLTHHADPRLTGVSYDDNGTFAAIYLGHKGNTVIPGKLRDLVDVHDVQDSEAFEATLSKLPQFGLHYGVRKEHATEGVFKPFTKGFTAAACGANILIQRDAHDALHYLGEDYPYLIDDATPKSINAGFFRARDDFGGPEWRRALDRMAQVADQSSPAQVAADLGCILDEVAC